MNRVYEFDIKSYKVASGSEKEMKKLWDFLLLDKKVFEETLHYTFETSNAEIFLCITKDKAFFKVIVK